MSKWVDSAPVAPSSATASALRRLLILDPAKCKFNSEAWHFLKRKSRECGRGCIEVVDTASSMPEWYLHGEPGRWCPSIF